ncbi:Venom serine protease 34 [Folsomia candida]|uniref:Venom serine protease 34 n=2 Tax=Folsomia candida TaxID=158441 RepID=A0A226E7K7_FOLCA|nr:Venom serine protease 34 [Folsomia candida]
MCTCTVISPSMVLTAAHCLSGISTSSRLLIKVGAIDKGATTEGGTSVWMSTKGYVKYPLYDGKQKHDIALVYLATRLTFSPSIHPACLPFSLRSRKLEGSVGTISGWGLTQWGGSASEKLIKADMPVLAEDVCRKMYGSYWPENNLCVGGQGRSACKGDSGGGLDIVVNGRSYTVGVAQGVAPQCMTNVPNIYMKVANYLDWISGISRLVRWRRTLSTLRCCG